MSRNQRRQTLDKLTQCRQNLVKLQGGVMVATEPYLERFPQIEKATQAAVQMLGEVDVLIELIGKSI